MLLCGAQGVQQPLTVSWADPERRAQLKRKFAGEPEPERQVQAANCLQICHTTNPKLYTLNTEVRHTTDKHRMCLWNPASCAAQRPQLAQSITTDVCADSSMANCLPAARRSSSPRCRARRRRRM